MPMLNLQVPQRINPIVLMALLNSNRILAGQFRALCIGRKCHVTTNRRENRPRYPIAPALPNDSTIEAFQFY